ncbi:MAG: carboxypeptidase-like regulatory domain-containing protein [Bacteroidales bacterium]|nr:carboxypeptidase-like regulatory domain-containing protein [Bacteroidales bacterium]
MLELNKNGIPSVDKYLRLLCLCAMFMLFAGCTEKIESTETGMKGSVKNITQDALIHPAYIIQGQELLATTDEDGNYEISSLEEGVYSLVCSALNYGDQSLQLAIEEGVIVDQDFLLTPDEQSGTLYGELHDQVLYDEQLISNPGMADWTGKELFDGVSGATIQKKSFPDLPPGDIYIGDSLFFSTDEYGQYWGDIQHGTYPIRVTLSEYPDSMQILRIVPDSSAFANFILTEE